MDIKCFIHGEEYCLADTYSITQQGGAVSSSSIDIKVNTGQDVPRSLMDVTLYFDTTPFFWGIIQSAETMEFSTAYEPIRYRLEILSGETIFNNRLVSESFIGKYTHEIIEFLFENYIEAEGITLGSISISNYVTGATEETSTTTESCYWAAEQAVFQTGYQIKSVAGATINGLLVGVGKIGVNEDDPNYTFLYTIGDKQLTLNSSASTLPATGDLVVVVYDGYTEQYYKNYNISFQRLYDVLFELAEDVNASFYISGDKKFYFITRDAMPQITAPAHITRLKLSEENGELRTVQYVTGATEETSTKTESCYWAAEQAVFPTGYQIKSVAGATINGLLVGVGKIGVNEDDPNYTFLYTIGDKQLTLNPSASTRPATGDLVVVVYNGYYEIVVNATNDTLKTEINALNGTSGIIENVLTDETIDNLDDAETRAANLLTAYGERDQTVTCACTDIASSSLYTVWDIYKPSLNIVGQYVITERTITNFGAGKVWIDLVLKNKGYFARYGTVLIDTEKSKGADVKVYKSSNIGDSLTASETWSIIELGNIYYPTDGLTLSDPELDGFYPSAE